LKLVLVLVTVHEEINGTSKNKSFLITNIHQVYFSRTVSGFQSCHGRGKKRDRKTENKSYKQRERERERK